MTKLITVVGGQFGSEAKGHVTARLVKRELADGAADIIVVRVAGPNAGHTAYDFNGVPHAFRQIPVGVVVDNDPFNNVVGVIAAGSEVDLDVLIDEIKRCNEYGIHLKLHVDPEVTLIEDEHKAAEQGRLGVEAEDLQQRLGSTAKGIGAARAGRIMRKAKRLCDDQAAMTRLLHEAGKAHVFITPATEVYKFAGWDAIIVEGTQGYGLGLHAGFYPYCTSSDCRAVDFLAMAGIHPWSGFGRFNTRPEVWVVARVYPIRVAGNSGPLRDETTWEALGLPPEYTTVTKKMRRVGMPDWDLVRRAVDANGGFSGGVVRVALTMVDQKFPHVAKATKLSDLDPRVRKWINEVAGKVGAHVGMVTVGPNQGINIR